MAKDIKHWEGGGDWTEIKLEAVGHYLQRFTAALKPTFKLWYIDAFAGSGRRIEEKVIGPFFDAQSVTNEIIEHEGSATRALAINPPFDHFVFIEKRVDRCAALEKLKTQHSDRNILILPGDANSELLKLIEQNQMTTLDRGVVFLDPFTLNVKWETLKALAATKKLDVWYLFHLDGLLRLLPHDMSKTEANAALLDDILTPGWREIYKKRNSEQDADLFGVIKEGHNRGDKKNVEAWLKKHLENIFEFVSDPIPLFKKQKQTFSLFLAVSNPNARAKNLAKEFVKSINKKHVPKASRRKFSP